MRVGQDVYDDVRDFSLIDGTDSSTVQRQCHGLSVRCNVIITTATTAATATTITATTATTTAAATAAVTSGCFPSMAQNTSQHIQKQTVKRSTTMKIWVVIKAMKIMIAMMLKT